MGYDTATLSALSMRVLPVAPSATRVDAASKVTGTLEGPNGPANIAGEVKEGVLGFTFGFDAGGTPMEIYVEAKVDAQDKIAGTMSVGDMGQFPFTGVRAKGL